MKTDLPIGTRVEKNGVTGTTASLRSKANFYAVEVDESGLLEIWDGVWINPIQEYYVVVYSIAGVGTIIHSIPFSSHKAAKETAEALGTDWFQIGKLTLGPQTNDN